MIEFYPTLPQLRPVSGGGRGVAGASAGTSFSDLLQRAAAPQGSLSDSFAKASATYQVPENLLRAIGYHESRYQTDAVSRCGAMGVMQLMPDTAKSMGVSDPFDADQNIMGGAKLMSQLLRKYDGDLKLALAAYGAGSGSVAKYGGVPPFEETQNFVTDILGAVDTDYVAPSGASDSFWSLLDQLSSRSGFSAEDYQSFIRLFLQEQEVEPGPRFFL